MNTSFSDRKNEGKDNYTDNDHPDQDNKPKAKYDEESSNIRLGSQGKHTQEH